MNPESQTQLDPQLVNLAKAIRQTESGGNFQAKGGSGEFGAYQFTEPTWNAAATKAGVNVPLSQATPQQQNEVAYKQLAEWKQQHPDWNVGNFASAWNAGAGNPNAYLNGNSGVNKYGVSYDTGKYASKVAQTYQQIKAGSQAGQQSQTNQIGYNPKPYSNPDGGSSSIGQVDFSGISGGATASSPADPNSLGGELSTRTNDASTAISNTISGKINPLSGVLQTVGAVAGGVNDVVGKALELVPGVKSLESFIGSKIGALAQTSTGQAVAKSIQSFSEAHPEFSEDIGAGFNIFTAIPIFEGLGTVKNLAKDGISMVLKNIAEKGAVKDLTEVASRTVAGRNILAAVPDAVSTMVEERALPQIEGKVYKTAEASAKIGAKIAEVENAELQPALARASTEQISDRMPLQTYRDAAVQTAKDELKDPAAVDSYFDRIREKYGDYPTLQDMNEAKRTVAKNISQAGFNSPTYTTDKIVRKALQQGVEDGAEKLGLGDVKAINQKMAKLIKTQDLLDAIDGKKVSTKGIVHTVIQGAATAGGELAGNAIGIPIAGAVVGSRVSGSIEGLLSRFSPRAIQEGILNRTAQGAERQTVKGLVGRTAGLAGAATVNQIGRKVSQKVR